MFFNFLGSNFGCVLYIRSIDFYIMVKIRFRGAYYTQRHIILEVLRYASGTSRLQHPFVGLKKSNHF